MKFFNWVSLCLIQLLLLSSVCAQVPGNYIVEAKLLTVNEGLSSQDVYCAVQDDFGFIWLGTKNGLNRYDGSRFRSLTKQQGLYSNTITNLVMDRENRLFVEFGNQWQPVDVEGRIDVLDVSNLSLISKKTSPNQYPLEIRNDLKEKRNWRIQSISMNQCWDSELAKEKEARLYVTSNSKIQLVVTKNNGIYYLERNKTIKVISSQLFFNNGNTTVNHFIRDLAGNVWICTEKGVFKVSITENKFKSIFTNFELSPNKIPQSRGIWTSQEKGMTVVYSVILNALVATHDNWKFNRIDGLGWGLTGVGDSLFYCVRNRFCAIKASTLDPIFSRDICSKENELIHSMCIENDSMMILGSSSQLIRVNRLNGRSEKISSKVKGIPLVTSVYRIFLSSKGIVALAENGLFIIRGNEIVDFYGFGARSKNRQLPNWKLLDAAEDADGFIWLATNGSGLCRWNWNSSEEDLKYSIFNTKDGLPSNVVYRIEEDAMNRLWLSTDEGLCSFSKSKSVFNVYAVEDGLPSQEFNRTSSYKDKNGKLYFGGVNGLVTFDPKAFLVDRVSPFFQVTRLGRYSGNESDFIDETWNYYQERKIQFYPSDYMIQLDVALLDFKSQNIKYWYKIKGVMEDWVLMDGSSLTLGSLPFGNHTLELRALASGGGNCFQEIQIPIEIIKPFYLRTWFFIVLVALIVVIIWSWIWLRGRVLRNRNQQLEKMVLKRTRDLKEALVDKDILLKELHHRVKNNLQLVISLLDLQKDQLRDEEAKKAINEGQMRLSSIAMIHQNFYNASDLSSISFDKFLIDLVNAVAFSFGQERDDVQVHVESQNMNIDIEAAIPLGLIVNELLTNAYKHIPQSYYPIKIQIIIKEIVSDELLLEFRDNGPGLPDLETFEFPKSLGLKLIKGLTSQLRGQISYSNTEGSLFEVRFKRQLK